MSQEHARAIRKVRKYLELNQAEFSRLVGVHPMTVSKWERGIVDPHPVFFMAAIRLGKGGAQ